MKKNRLKTKTVGFTLTETLFVLGIISFLSFLPTLLFTQWQKVVQAEQFLATFEKQLVWTQQNAIIWEQNMDMYFSEAQQTFTFTEIKGGAKQSRSFALPAGLKGQGPTKITFVKNSGNNRYLGKYIFYWEARKQRIEYQFQLGSGKCVKKVYET